MRLSQSAQDYKEKDTKSLGYLLWKTKSCHLEKELSNCKSSLFELYFSLVADSEETL